MTPLRLAAVAAAALLVGACQRDRPAGQDVLAQDSTLTRDLQLANRDTLAQPQLRDVATNTPPAAPAPSAPAPAPAPAAQPRQQQAPHTHSTPATPAPRPERQRVARAPAPTGAPTPVEPPPPAPVTTPSGNTVQERAATGLGSSEGRLGVVSAGTSLALMAGQRVCTNTNAVGDRITASLAEAVTASNGIVIPAGATAVVEVTSLERSQQAGQDMRIGLAVRSVSYGGKTYPVTGDVTAAQTEQVRGADNNDAGKVAGGAVIGAILGNILGGRSRTRGTVIGAAGGAAAGAVLARRNAKYDACIPAGGRIAVRLTAPLTVQSAATGAAGGVI